MVRVNTLKNLDPVAWTALLGQDERTRRTVVTAVQNEPLEGRRNLTRYILALDGYVDPITFIGKQTNAIEARFYYEISPELRPLTPKAWFIHMAGDESWILLDEVHNNLPSQRWGYDDIELVTNSLASLHANYWEKVSQLNKSGLVDALGGYNSPHSRLSRRSDATPEKTTESQGSKVGLGHTNPNSTGKQIISQHAQQAAGSLADTLMKAAAGLRALQAVGGWPGIVNEQQISAVADLIDDPLPLLYPLRELPVTLLHGDPSYRRWNLSLLGECRLLDWQRIAIGPGICDLVSFIEGFYSFEKDIGGLVERSHWPVSEETIVDSYLLAMGGKLGSRFHATDHRLAIPAARCLYLLITWLPTIANWFQLSGYEVTTWQKFNGMSDEQLAEAGYVQMIGIRSHLAKAFERFLVAYRSL